MKTDILCGLSAVRAVFDRRPQEVQRLFYTEALRREAGDWCKLLAASRRPYRMLPAEELARVAGSEHHGGIVAVAAPRNPSIMNPMNMPAAASPRHERDVLILLDGIGNPHNLGAIARSAAFFGALGLVLHELPGAAMPSTAAHRTAEGGMEYLHLWRTRNLAGAIGALDREWRTVAAVPDPNGPTLADLPRDRPIALVLGHEEHGFTQEVLDATRRRVTIAGSRQIESLNVAQAAAVLLFGLS
jgi:TrmH RNA methyltransferase